MLICNWLSPFEFSVIGDAKNADKGQITQIGGLWQQILKRVPEGDVISIISPFVDPLLYNETAPDMLRAHSGENIP
jgi:hypothetical protein